MKQEPNGEEIKKDISEIKAFIKNFGGKFTQLVIELTRR